MNIEADRPRRVLLRLTVRAFLVLIALLAVPIAWKTNHARTQRRAVDALRKKGFEIHWSFEVYKPEPGDVHSDPFWVHFTDPDEPSWFRRRLGDEYCGDVVAVCWEGSEEFRDADLEPLESLGSVEEVQLDGCSVTDAGFAHLGRLKRLRRLRVTGDGDRTDAGLAHLKGLRRLDTLDLRSESLTDAGLAHLSGLTGLRYLAIRSPHVTDAGLAHLAGLRVLTELRVESPGITDAGLVYLRGMKNLINLHVRSPRVTDAGLTHLAGLRDNLSGELDLSGAAITDVGLAEIVKFSKLQHLDISDTRITDAGVPLVKKLTRLRYLEPYGSKATCKGVLAVLDQMPNDVFCECDSVEGWVPSQDAKPAAGGMVGTANPWDKMTSCPTPTPAPSASATAPGSGETTSTPPSSWRGTAGSTS